MNKWVIGIVAVLVVLGLFFYFRDSPDLAPKQTTQNTDADSNNNLYSTVMANLNVTVNGTVIKQPYFCQYSIFGGGGGGGCPPNTPCSCFDTDGGNNPCTFGRVNITLNQTTLNYTDYCINNNLLSEFHCLSRNDSTILTTYYNCTNGCSNGVCI